MKKKAVIVGSSGHAKVVIDIFEKAGEYEILGLIDSFRSAGEETCGYKILESEEIVPKLLWETPEIEFFVAIGDNFSRAEIVLKLEEKSPTIKFATAIHPSAQIGRRVAIGRGTAVMAGAVINADTKIGDFTIVNTKASVDHDCALGDFSSVAPGATLGGNVIVGDYSAVSIGATVLQKTAIGDHSVIGAGAVLTKDCGSQEILYGVPAKFVRKREKGESYL